jgi:hypothetical protein
MGGQLRSDVGGETPKAIRASMETTEPLYSLLVGQSVAFPFSRTGGGVPDSQHPQDCTVEYLNTS